MAETEANLAGILTGLRSDINSLKETFNVWREQVYATGIDRTQKERNTETETDMGRWAANEEAHQEILRRLDLLNGFRNKVAGVSQVLLFASPIAVAAWAILTR